MFLALTVVGPVVGRAGEAELAEIRDLAASGRTYEALTRLEPLLQAEPQPIEGLMLKGILLSELDRVDEAKDIFLGLIEAFPQLPEPYVNLAALYAATGDNDRAVQFLKQALATNPSYMAAYESLTKVYGKLASEAYRRALGSETETAEAPVELVLLDRIHRRPEPQTGAAAVDVQEAISAGQQQASLTPGSRPEPSASREEHFGESTPAAVAVDYPEEPVTESIDTAEDRTPQPPGPDPERVPEMIDSWARAWTEQRVEEYLRFYSAEFTPSKGLSREGWEIMRRGRLTGPGFISISVKDLEVEKKDPGRVEARFVQAYSSDVLHDSCVKALSLIWEEGSWKIAAERIEE